MLIKQLFSFLLIALSIYAVGILIYCKGFLFSAQKSYTHSPLGNPYIKEMRFDNEEQ